MAQPDGGGQDVDLESGVVEIIFGGDGESGVGEDSGEGVAVCGAASVSDVERAGGVGGDEFQMNELILRRAASELLGILENLADDGGFVLRADADVDESGSGDVGGFDESGRSPVLEDVGGDLAGILLERRGELHGGGRGEIAHLTVFGAFNQGCCGGDLRVRRKGATGGGQGGGQFGFEVGEHKSLEL